MYHVQCAGCGTSAYLDCDCPPAVTAAGVHLDRCRMADPDSAVACPPGSGCCQETHAPDGHRPFGGHVVYNCPADHSGEPCPAPADCRLHKSVLRHYAASRAAAEEHARLVERGEAPPGEHYAGRLAEPPAECPGGHHDHRLASCLACRSLIITAVGQPGAPAATLAVTS